MQEIRYAVAAGISGPGLLSVYFGPGHTNEGFATEEEAWASFSDARAKITGIHSNAHNPETKWYIICFTQEIQMCKLPEFERTLLLPPAPPEAVPASYSRDLDGDEIPF